MMNKLKKFTLVILLFSLVLGPFSWNTAQAKAQVSHSFDDAALLMISAQMRLDEDSDAAWASGQHLAMLVPQTDSGNEIDVLLQLYIEQINQLRTGNHYSPELEAQLLNQLEAKVQILQRRSQALAARRHRRRGFFRRMFRSIGRGTGWLLGKAMEGSGKIVQFAVEEVAPRVLREAVLNGTPVNAALVRQAARKLLKNRLQTLLSNKLGHMAGVAEQAQQTDDDEIPLDLAPVPETQQASADATQPPAEGAATPSLNLTPQEQAAEGVHAYSSIYYNTTGDVSTVVDYYQVEYVFTETGVELYFGEHSYVTVYIKIGPNQYRTKDGNEQGPDYTLTFTGEGYVLAGRAGDKRVATRLP